MYLSHLSQLQSSQSTQINHDFETNKKKKKRWEQNKERNKFFICSLGQFPFFFLVCVNGDCVCVCVCVLMKCVGCVCVCWNEMVRRWGWIKCVNEWNCEMKCAHLYNSFIPPPLENSSPLSINDRLSEKWSTIRYKPF